MELNQEGGLVMRQDSGGRTKDISVLQLLTRLVQETDKVIRLADDIDQLATTPQARSALNLIGSEVNNILAIMKVSFEPLYRLYELDPGMKKSKADSDKLAGIIPEPETGSTDAYDENSLWAELKTKSQAIKPPEGE
jgi:hypothetical protein